MNSNPSPTKSLVKLTEGNLSHLPELVRIPKYDRSQVTHGLVHFGVGGFHRAHQALYLDNYLEQHPNSDWSICGVGLLEFDRKMRDVMHSQNCLYTLVERSPAGDNARIIGSISQYLFAPDDHEAVIAILAAPQCRIVTLTITEGGYYVVEGTGEFDVGHPTIQHDLQNPDEPHGIYGFLAAALNRRQQRGIPPFTVLSCDNLQGNGDLVGSMLTAFAKRQNPDLGRWIEENVAFPNSMVDRITPSTTPTDIQMVRDRFGIDDSWPVVAEPFSQWVIEDKFCAGRPDWESVGVQMTDDVRPYEMMKLRLLNASHSLIGYLGSLLGYSYTSEAMDDPLIRQVVERLMDEVSSTLPPLPGIQLDRYKQTLIERFANTKVRDQLSRLCLNGSDKIPKFILGSLRDKLAQDGAITYLSFAIALWFRYLNGKDEQGQSLPINDPMATLLTEKALMGKDDPTPLLSISQIFGNLSNSREFITAVTHHLQQLYALGTQETVSRLFGK
ncbi:mannitol dehydrogenase family protein [Sphaerothrix gracilis]|uniref:mannitol dehydrogenase family protein n=1 Tax=Sphaerothrix gracilis TaxID=3151835 RepID=UPI0031FC748E